MVVISEMFPFRLRAVAMSLALFLNRLVSGAVASPYRTRTLKRQADKYERFVYRVDATAFPPLSRQASLQPSPTPPNRSSSSPAPLSRGNSDVLAPDSRPPHPTEPPTEPPAGPPACPPAGPPAGPPIWSWQSDKASGVWS